MAFQLGWEIEGEKQLSRVLFGLNKDITNLHKPFETATRRMRTTFEKDVFLTRGRVIDESWKPLSPVTIARKARLGQSRDPLVATGKMKRSFKTIVTNDMGVVYNTAEYFKYHQSNQPRSRLPRRVMMKLANDQREEIVQIFHKHIYQALKK